MSAPRDDLDVWIAKLVKKGLSIHQISVKTSKSQTAIEYRCAVMNLPISGGKNKGESTETRDFLKTYYRGYYFPNPDGYPVEKPKLIIGGE